MEGFGFVTCYEGKLAVRVEANAGLVVALHDTCDVLPKVYIMCQCQDVGVKNTGYLTTEWIYLD